MDELLPVGTKLAHLFLSLPPLLLMKPLDVLAHELGVLVIELLVHIVRGPLKFNLLIEFP